MGLFNLRMCILRLYNQIYIFYNGMFGYSLYLQLRLEDNDVHFTTDKFIISYIMKCLSLRKIQVNFVFYYNKHLNSVIFQKNVKVMYTV